MPSRITGRPSWPLPGEPDPGDDDKQMSAVKNDNGIKWYASGKLTLGAVVGFALAAAGWGYSIKSTAADAARETKETAATLATLKGDLAEKDREAKQRAKDEEAWRVRIEKSITRVETLLERQAKP